MTRRGKRLWLGLGHLALASVVGTLAGAEGPDAAEVGWNRDYAASLPRDAARIATAPVRWDLGDVGALTLCAGAVAAAYAIESPTRGWILDHRNAITDEVAHVVKPFGREALVLGLAATAVTSAFVDDPRVARTALLSAESALVAGIAHFGIQTLIDRPRPNQDGDHDTVHRPGWRNDGRSFPSGHTTAAFAVAGVVAHEWRDVPGAAIAAYGMATLVGLSRMHDDAHWASDVVAGAILGIASAWAVEGLHPRRHSPKVAPVMGRDGAGLAMRWDF